MTAQNSTEEKKSPPKAQETTRLLLALWELGASTKAFKKGELPDRAKRPTTVFNHLVEDGAIKVAKQKSYALVASYNSCLPCDS